MVILAAVDRSERAGQTIDEAVRLSNAFGEPVHAVHVLSQAEFIELEQTEAKQRNTAIGMDRIREFAASVAADASSDIETPVECVGLVGDATDRIIEYAEEHDVRYIVVTARNRSPTGKVVFGSVAQKLLLNAPCPVVVSVDRANE